VKWPEQEDETIHDNNTSLTIERERERERERESNVAAAAAVVPQELGSLCKALGFASIKVVCGGANNREASKQASAGANVLMMLKRGGREGEEGREEK
jgi:TATA-box binding protein (TBP) (component of TFIID and TFIIIB)